MFNELICWHRLYVTIFCICSGYFNSITLGVSRKKCRTFVLDHRAYLHRVE